MDAYHESGGSNFRDQRARHRAERGCEIVAKSARIPEQAIALDDLAVGRSAQLAPGTVLGLRDEFLVVACGSGCLGIAELQRAGRRTLAAREFCNGIDLSAEVLA